MKTWMTWALALKGELLMRRYGDEVRLEVADNCPRHLIEYLLQKFELGEEDLYEVNGPVNLARMFTDVKAPAPALYPLHPARAGPDQERRKHF